MQKSINKYHLKILSIILLISFLNISIGICGFVINSCKTDNTSCCCKNHDNDVSSMLKLEKTCCCEVKEVTAQPSKIKLILTETFQKNVLNASCIFSDREISNSNFISGYTRVLSFHSPPGEKIHILNSNFRI